MFAFFHPFRIPFSGFSEPGGGCDPIFTSHFAAFREEVNLNLLL
jgi:hypothetical protein